MEAAELVYLTMHHESYDDLKQRILLTYGAKYDQEQERAFSERMDFLARLQERTETLLDFQDPRLGYFFERHTVGSAGHCCLATVLISSFNDAREEDPANMAGAMLARWKLLSGPDYEISEISYSGLTYRRREGQARALHEQINALDCALEFKWKIMTALCAYEAHLRELLTLLQPVLEELQQELEKMEPLLEPVYEYWRACMDGTTLEELLPRIGPGQGDSHLNPQKITVRFWRTPCNRMCLTENWGAPGEFVAYIGIIVELDDAADGSQVSDRVICSMLRAIGDDSKFAIMKLLRRERMYGQEIGERLGLHHGTVSRHLSSLYRSGLVSMEKGNGRVCYYTINRKGFQRLLEILSKLFLEDAEPQEALPAQPEGEEALPE